MIKSSIVPDSRRFKRLARRIADFMDRYRKPLAVAQWLCFAISCASISGFIRLPEIAIPAYVGVLLTSLRYAIWEGFLKTKLLGDTPDDVKG